MSDPNVSVIIPAYNCGSLVGEAIASACSQSYDDYEVIVVDDGSTDDTWQAICEAIEGKANCRAIQAEHKGLAAARNRAIAEMRGKWIALLDADDLWLPEKLQRCMDFLAEHPDLKIVYTPMAPVRMDGSRMTGHSKACHGGQLTERLFHSIFVHDPASVFHKRVIETCGGFDESLPVCVGHEFWLRVSTKFEFGLIDEPLALRRWSERSLTRSNRSRARCIKAGMLERFYFEKGGRSLLSDQKRALRRLARVHYSAGKQLMKERNYPDAETYFAKSLRWAPAYVKVWPLYLACKVGSLVGFSGGKGV